MQRLSPLLFCLFKGSNGPLMVLKVLLPRTPSTPNLLNPPFPQNTRDVVRLAHSTFYVKKLESLVLFYTFKKCDNILSGFISNE